MLTRHVAFFLGLVITIAYIQESQSVINSLMSQKYRKPNKKPEDSKPQQQQLAIQPEGLNRIPADRNRWRYSGKNGPYETYEYWRQGRWIYVKDKEVGAELHEQNGKEWWWRRQKKIIYCTHFVSHIKHSYTGMARHILPNICKRSGIICHKVFTVRKAYSCYIYNYLSKCVLKHLAVVAPLHENLASIYILMY